MHEKGEKLKIKVKSRNLETEAIGDYVVEEAKKAPTSREQIITALGKLGDTYIPCRGYHPGC